MSYDKNFKTFSIGISDYEASDSAVLAGINFEWGKQTPSSILPVLESGPAIFRLMEAVMQGLKEKGYDFKETPSPDDVSMGIYVNLPKGNHAYLKFAGDFKELVEKQIAADPEPKALVTRRGREQTA